MLVGFGQPGCNLARNSQSFLNLQPGGNLFTKRSAFVKCHGDEHVAARGFVDIVDHNDIGVIQGGRGAGLIAEPPLQLAVMGQMRREEFQRDQPAELGIKRLVYDSHAAGTDLLLDLVVGDNLSRELQRPAWRPLARREFLEQFYRGPIQNLAVRILRQQPLDFPPKLGVRVLQHSYTPLARRMVELFDLSPAVGRHNHTIIVFRYSRTQRTREKLNSAR